MGQFEDTVRFNAGALRASGIGAGDRFAVLDKNHPACIEMTLAASLTAANVDVNFRPASGELAYVLSDSMAQVVMAGAEFAESMEGVRDRRQVIVLGGDGDG